MLEGLAPLPASPIPVGERALERTPAGLVGATQFAAQVVAEQVVVPVDRLRARGGRETLHQGVALVQVLEHGAGIGAPREFLGQRRCQLATGTGVQQETAQLVG